MKLDELSSTVMLPHAVTLTFDFLTWLVCLRPTYIRNPILVKIFTKILYSPGFLVIACGDLTWPLIPETNQHIYEHKYIFNQNWVKFPLLGCEIWCSQGFLVIACCDLDVWLFDLISMSHVHHLILVKLAQIITKIKYSPCFPGHCLLWLWHLTFWS